MNHVGGRRLLASSFRFSHILSSVPPLTSGKKQFIPAQTLRALHSPSEVAFSTPCFPSLLPPAPHLYSINETLAHTAVFQLLLTFSSKLLLKLTSQTHHNDAPPQSLQKCQIFWRLNSLLFYFLDQQMAVKQGNLRDFIGFLKFTGDIIENLSLNCEEVRWKVKGHTYTSPDDTLDRKFFFEMIERIKLILLHVFKPSLEAPALEILPTFHYLNPDEYLSLLRAIEKLMKCFPSREMKRDTSNFDEFSAVVRRPELLIDCLWHLCFAVNFCLDMRSLEAVIYGANVGFMQKKPPFNPQPQTCHEEVDMGVYPSFYRFSAMHWRELLFIMKEITMKREFLAFHLRYHPLVYGKDAVISSINTATAHLCEVFIGNSRKRKMGLDSPLSSVDGDSLCKILCYLQKLNAISSVLLESFFPHLKTKISSINGKLLVQAIVSLKNFVHDDGLRLKFLVLCCDYLPFRLASSDWLVRCPPEELVTWLVNCLITLNIARLRHISCILAIREHVLRRLTDGRYTAWITPTSKNFWLAGCLPAVSSLIFTLASLEMLDLSFLASLNDSISSKSTLTPESSILTREGDLESKKLLSLRVQKHPLSCSDCGSTSRRKHNFSFWETSAFGVIGPSLTAQLILSLTCFLPLETANTALWQPGKYLDNLAQEVSRCSTYRENEGDPRNSTFHPTANNLCSTLNESSLEPPSSEGFFLPLEGSFFPEKRDSIYFTSSKRRILHLRPDSANDIWEPSIPYSPQIGSSRSLSFFSELYHQEYYLGVLINYLKVLANKHPNKSINKPEISRLILLAIQSFWLCVESYTTQLTMQTALDVCSLLNKIHQIRSTSTPQDMRHQLPPPLLQSSLGGDFNACFLPFSNSETIGVMDAWRKSEYEISSSSRIHLQVERILEGLHPTQNFSQYPLVESIQLERHHNTLGAGCSHHYKSNYIRRNEVACGIFNVDIVIDAASPLLIED